MGGVRLIISLQFIQTYIQTYIHKQTDGRTDRQRDGQTYIIYTFFWGVGCRGERAINIFKIGTR